MPAELTLPAGVDPALTYPRPDLEKLIWDTVRATTPDGKSIRSWVYSTVGDSAPTGWLLTSSVQIDVWADTKHAAFVRADRARRALLALPWADWPEGVITRADVLDGPFWFPDPGSNKPRYVARYAVQTHPRPAKRGDRR